MSRLILIAATLLIGFAIGLGTGWFWWKSATNPQEVKSPLAFKNTARDGRAPKQSNPPLNLQKHGQEKKEGDPKELTGTASSANDKLPVPAKTAKDIIDQILSEIESSGSEKADGQKIWKRLQKLRKFGEEGSQAILEFLRTNKDISSGPNGWGNFLHEGLSAERYVQFHSLREGLLEVLYEMKSPTAQTASLEALQTTSSAKEVLLAIRNLEKVSTGTYRAEALQAMSAVLTELSKEPDDRYGWQDCQIIGIVGYYQARELIPLVEDLVKKQPRSLSNWLQCLDQLPAEDQIGTLERLSADEKIRETIVADDYYLVRLDYRNDRLRQMTGEFFKEMPANQKINLIQRVGESGTMNFGGGFTIEFAQSTIPAYHKKDGIEASLKLLSEIEPTLDSDILKAYLEVSRLKLQEALAKAKE